MNGSQATGERLRRLVTACGLGVVLWHGAAADSAAQRSERYFVRGERVAVYNLAGEVLVERGEGRDVVVEVRRGGADGDRLVVERGPIGGSESLRIVYPSDRVVYTGWGARGQTTIRVRPDGTFGSPPRMAGRVSSGAGLLAEAIKAALSGGDGQRVRISGSGRGLEAHADLRIQVPEGRSVAVYLGVGRAQVTNVNGTILVDVAAASVSAQRVRGSLLVDTGSGSVRVEDVEGDVGIDTGSGRVEVRGVRGSRLIADTGSGAITVAEADVTELNLDTGSGRIEALGVRARDVRLDTGSGSVTAELLSDVRNVRISTGSGGVRLAIPETVNADLEVSTGSGGIRVEGLTLQQMEQARSRLRGRLGDGSGRIKIDTGSGGVRLTRAEGGLTI